MIFKFYWRGSRIGNNMICLGAKKFKNPVNKMWSRFCGNYLRSLFLNDFYLITYFLRSYISKLGYEFSSSNNIFNFKTLQNSGFPSQNFLCFESFFVRWALAKLFQMFDREEIIQIQNCFSDFFKICCVDWFTKSANETNGFSHCRFSLKHNTSMV